MCSPCYTLTTFFFPLQLLLLLTVYMKRSVFCQAYSLLNIIGTKFDEIHGEIR